ncbi:type VI secretion system tube protein Hcp, partial [Klebsiella pneumoniae]|uniref:type VI secretion system tube protein Hcp n=1 Tax=Klebsiella pneumoniae TaxID=573 RepID=UPI00217E40B0
TSCPNRIPVISKLVLVLDIYSSLSLIWRYSYCLVFQGATSKISDAGQEVEYFNMLLEGVRIVSISPTMASPEDKNNNHLESVELRYEKITWKHCDGNIIFTDAWNERQTA